jgi:anaerobic selenocysteine-containing dehydrogenase
VSREGVANGAEVDGQGIRTHYRGCNLCEALCGLEIVTQGDRVLSIKPDRLDAFSQGHICPKGVAVQDIHFDPDRLRYPVERRGSQWVEVSWEHGFALAAERLIGIREEFGPSAVGAYGGNPAGHNADVITHGSAFFGALGTPNFFSASTQDQVSLNVAAHFLYGHQWLVPIPDIDHTQHLLIIGGNPMASNGSFMTVPNFPGRIRALRERGGKLVVIDPRRSETARVADTHLFLRPGTDPWLLLAMIRLAFENGMVRLGRLADCVDGLDELREAVQPFTLERAARITGVTADAIVGLVEDFFTADRAVAYGRIGASYQLFGTITQWAIQLLNLLSGNLDRVGGALPAHPAAPAFQSPQMKGGYGPAVSRVRGLRSFSNTFSSVVMAEELLTPGPGQIKAMITYCGNPVSSVPNGREVERGFAGLEFMLSIDYYINETTRFADLILPPVSPLERYTYELLFLSFPVRNFTRYSQPVFPKPPGTLYEWEIYAGLTRAYNKRLGKTPAPQVDSAVMLNQLLAQGFHPDLTIEKIASHTHGLDLGPLKPSLKERLSTDNGHVNAAPHEIVSDLPRLLSHRWPGESDLVLIGRRHTRSNNSWMNNSERLTKGKPRHLLQMHPDDLAVREIVDGALVQVSSRVASVEIEVSASDDIMPGVVSMPHGFGQNRPGVRLRVATQLAGPSFNDLADDQLYDRPSGSSVLTGIPVTVQTAAATAVAGQSGKDGLLERLE